MSLPAWAPHAKQETFLVDGRQPFDPHAKGPPDA